MCAAAPPDPLRRDRPGPGERIGPACPVVVAPEFPELKWEDTPLTDGHKQALQDAVNEYNAEWQGRHTQRMAG